MARKKRNNGLLHLPSRQLVAAGGQVFLLSCVAALVVLGKNGNPYVNRLSTQTMEVVAPVLSVAASPFEALGETLGGLKNWATTYDQNQKLKAENRTLLQWQAQAKALEAENQQLRALMKVVPDAGQHFVSARFVSGLGNAYSNSAIIHAGSGQDVQRNQAVVSESGLIGRTIDVSKNHSRVMLLSDVNSRIPVMNERTRDKMIMVGKGDAQPILSYISASHQMLPGDRLITSGDGNLLPQGIAVGTITSLDAKNPTAQLFADPQAAEYVSIVQLDR